MQEYWLFAALICLTAVIIALLSKLAQQRDELAEAVKETRRSRMLWDSFPGVVAEIRPDGTIINISSAAVGVVDANVKGRRVQEFLPDDSRAIFLTNLNIALETFAPVEYQLQAMGSDGEMLWFRNQLMPVIDSGKLKSLLIISSDITDLQKIQRELIQQKELAERQSEVKSRFLANMSHEIRTPLNGMLGVMGLLEGTPLTARQRLHFETLQQGADHLLAIVNDVLDLSRMESGHLVLAEESFDLSELLHRVAAIVHAKASEKRLALQLFVDDNVPEYVRGDPLRISQVLLNLLNNAVKFTAKGHVILRVVVRDEERHLLRFSVEDTGIGIEAEKAQHLFGEYALAHGEVSQALGGTGLGLNICKLLSDAMGGRIGVASSPGTGSCFWVDLPLPLIACPVSWPTDREFEGRVVWTADSFAVNRTLIQSVANKIGLKVRSFDRLRDLLKALETDAPDILVLSRRFFSAPDARPHEFPFEGGMKLIVTCDEGNSDNWEPPGLVSASWSWPVDQRQMQGVLLRLLQGESALGAREDSTEQSSGNESSDEAWLNVLLVEDNPVNRKVMEQMLKKMHCHVASCGHGKEALEYLEDSENTDLVVMDWHMPVMDGLEATREIRRRKALQHITVIALSGDTDEEQQKQFIEAGADQYLVKPVRPGDLLSALNEVRQAHRREE